MFYEIHPCLDGVQRMLGENVCPGGGSGKRINHRYLYDVKSMGRPGDVAPGFVVHERNAGTFIQVACEVSEPAVNRADYAVVDLHSHYGFLVEHQCRQNVSPPSGSDDEHFAVV